MDQGIFPQDQPDNPYHSLHDSRSAPISERRPRGSLLVRLRRRHHLRYALLNHRRDIPPPHLQYKPQTVRTLRPPSSASARHSVTYPPRPKCPRPLSPAFQPDIKSGIRASLSDRHSARHPSRPLRASLPVRHPGRQRQHTFRPSFRRPIRPSLLLLSRPEN